MIKNICVYCSSSTKVDKIFFDFCEQFGIYLAKEGYNLVFGGADIGLMGHLARAVVANHGKVIGVIPKETKGTPYVFERADEIIYSDDIRHRKAIMDENSDAFIALPGGFGTLDEIIEMLTLKQVHRHNRPIIFANQNGFYNPLNTFFEHLFEQQFASTEHHRQLYYMSPGIEDIFAYLKNYTPPETPARWF